MESAIELRGGAHGRRRLQALGIPFFAKKQRLHEGDMNWYHGWCPRRYIRLVLLRRK